MTNPSNNRIGRSNKMAGRSDQIVLALGSFEIFVIILTLLLVSWSLVSFWRLFLENLFYRTFGFDPTNTWISFWVSVVITTGFIFIVWLIKIIIFPTVDQALIGREEGQNNEGEPLGGADGSISNPTAVGVPEPIPSF